MWCTRKISPAIPGDSGYRTTAPWQSDRLNSTMGTLLHKRCQSQHPLLFSPGASRYSGFRRYESPGGCVFRTKSLFFFITLNYFLCVIDTVWLFVLQDRLRSISLQTTPGILGKVASFPLSVGKVLPTILLSYIVRWLSYTVLLQRLLVLEAV